jgi:phosphatidylinositol-3,4,5-trisphosphate 3-phosphatase/dual-specificity protein phosphatase PTEN
MDFLREIVGGPKNRYKENGYNLDLTYITPRIIAMAFPASGLEKLYRNNIDTIAELLETEHHGKYITINMSGRGIDEHILKNVINYEWEDHKAPPFDMLFSICDRVAQFLNQDPENIAVFHCNHGKGRTGTIICCFFLFMNTF